MSVIYRWVAPEDQESILIKVPEDCELAEAVEFTEEGVGLREMHLERPEPNEAIEFPLVHIWDDPSRSEPLQRHGIRWETEDTKEMLRLWEETRLTQFYSHLLVHYKAMQVVYLQPPTIEAVSFNQDGEFYQGWRIEMVAAIFGGFIPPDLEAWSFGTKSKVYAPDTKLVKPNLELV